MMGTSGTYRTRGRSAPQRSGVRATYPAAGSIRRASSRERCYTLNDAGRIHAMFAAARTLTCPQCGAALHGIRGNAKEQDIVFVHCDTCHLAVVLAETHTS